MIHKTPVDHWRDNRQAQKKYACMVLQWCGRMRDALKSEEKIPPK